MAKTQALPLPEEPATDTQIQIRPTEMIELITRDITTRALTTTSVLQEILTRGDERRYTTHWGINE